MNQDTVSLLQECSAGANMAISAIDQVMEGVENPALRDALLASRRAHGDEVVECVDNDETAGVVAQLVGARHLVLLTSTDGIYLNKDDPSTLVRLVTGGSVEQVRTQVKDLMEHCNGASRAGANGARAKLAFAMQAVEHGANVTIGHARYRIGDLMSGAAPCTRLGVGLEEHK